MRNLEFLRYFKHFGNLDPVHFVFCFTISCEATKAEFEPGILNFLKLINNKRLLITFSNYWNTKMGASELLRINWTWLHSTSSTCVEDKWLLIFTYNVSCQIYILICATLWIKSHNHPERLWQNCEISQTGSSTNLVDECCFLQNFWRKSFICMTLINKSLILFSMLMFRLGVIDEGTFNFGKCIIDKHGHCKYHNWSKENVCLFYCSRFIVIADKFSSYSVRTSFNELYITFRNSKTQTLKHQIISQHLNDPQAFKKNTSFEFNLTKIMFVTITHI